MRYVRDDRGVSLVEVIVSMSIFSVLLAIFTTGVLSMFSSANKNMAMATTVSQANLVFIQLDKQIRYAGAIASPSSGLTSGTYVEYLISVANVGYCHELWYDPAQHSLKTRVWVSGTTPGKVWSTLATGVTATTPFTLLAPARQFTFQRLKLNLTTTSGSGRSTTTAQTSVTFTALNTTATTQNPATCTNGRPTT